MFKRLTPARLIVAIAGIGLFAMAARPAVDSDTFWHLRAGTWMLDHRQILTFDVFSHTRTGQPWINHSWLSEIPMAALFAAFGYSGLNLTTAVIIWLAFFFVYRSGAGGPYLRVFAVLLAAVTSALYWSARPQIVSLLFTAIFNYILILYRVRRVNRLWLLPPIMLAWANLHGGFAIGFILLAAALVGEMAEGFRQRMERIQRIKDVIWIGGIGLACAVAATVNPYDGQMLLYPFKTVSIGVLQNYIQEWQSPNFHAREAQVFIVLWLATFGAAGFSRKRLEVTDFLLFAAFTALALLAGRNVAAFAVVAAPILMRHADSVIAEAQARWPELRLDHDHDGALKKRLIILNWALLFVVVAAAAVKVSIPLQAVTTESAIARTLPVGAASYLKANPPPGLMFNSYNFGGYLAWALYPDVPVYVDGRTDLYDDEFLTEYLNTALAGPGWERTLIDHNIGFVVVESGSPLARELERDLAWAVRYRDPLAIVIVKVDPGA